MTKVAVLSKQYNNLFDDVYESTIMLEGYGEIAFWGNYRKDGKMLDNILTAFFLSAGEIDWLYQKYENKEARSELWRNQDIIKKRDRAIEMIEEDGQCGLSLGQIEELVGIIKSLY